MNDWDPEDNSEPRLNIISDSPVDLSGTITYTDIPGSGSYIFSPGIWTQGPVATNITFDSRRVSWKSIIAIVLNKIKGTSFSIHI